MSDETTKLNTAYGIRELTTCEKQIHALATKALEGTDDDPR